MPVGTGWMEVGGVLCADSSVADGASIGHNETRMFDARRVNSECLSENRVNYGVRTTRVGPSDATKI